MKTKIVGGSDVSTKIAMVDSGLLRRYEVSQLNGCDLRQLNEDYNALLEKRAKIIDRDLVSMFLLLVAGIVVVSTDFSWLTGIILGLLLLATSIVRVVWKRVSKQARKIMKEISPRLDAFCEVLEKLVHPLGREMKTYDAKTIGDSMFWHAVQILMREREFDKARLSPAHRDISLICSYGESLMRFKDQFEAALKAAEKFGLKFDKRQLFEEARVHLSQHE